MYSMSLQGYYSCSHVVERKSVRCAIEICTCSPIIYTPTQQKDRFPEGYTGLFIHSFIHYEYTGLIQFNLFYFNQIKQKTGEPKT